MLECIERHGLPFASSCRSGVCQSCRVRAVEGRVPAAAQVGLRPSLRARGYFLACLCRPEGDLVLDTDEAAAAALESVVLRTRELGEGVVGVWLRRPEGFEFAAGQFVHVVRPADGLMRPYSIASTSGADAIELHVAVAAAGRMSSWLAAAAGEPVGIRGPVGECCYSVDDPSEPLLLAGTGTGLAPLLGVVRTAVAAGHRGPMRLFHGARAAAALYAADELRGLAAAAADLTVTRCAPDGDGAEVRRERVEERIAVEAPRLAGWRVYVCGNPDFVRRQKKAAYLAGAALDAIHADPFVESPASGSAG